MQLTGAQIVIECLKEQGVDTVFGYPGGAILNVYDELYKHQGEIRHVLTSHEQGASHAADGYARSTGKVGVCFATSGPGATNLVTGIATAYMDSVPVVAITCNVTVPLLGKDSFQEIDIAGITMPITKHNFIVKDVTKLADTIRRAFKIAQTGRPGPVLVDIPKDITAAKTEYTSVKPKPIARITDTISEEDVDTAVSMIKAAKKPYIFVGGGAVISGASEELKKFVEKVNAPVCDTLMGKGAFNGTDDSYTGMLGMHGNVGPNRKTNECDVLIAIGMRFDDRVTGRLQDFASHARIVHIDIDPTSIRKNVEVDVPVVGDCRQALEGILEICRAKMADTDWSGMHADWLQTVHEWKANHPLAYNKNGHIKPQQVIETMYSITKGDAIIATEVGQNQMWAAQFYTFTKPRTLLTSGGLGTMGYGFPAAIGAQFAFPDKLVINVAGDGSIQMNIQELATVVQNKIPVKVVILNNGHLGMVRQWQELFYNRNYSHTNMEAQPDFVKLAEAYGAEGYRISKPEELEDVLRKALTSPNPAFIDVMVEREENVYPMVPAGAALDEMLLV